MLQMLCKYRSASETEMWIFTPVMILLCWLVIISWERDKDQIQSQPVEEPVHQGMEDKEEPLTSNHIDSPKSTE